MSMRFLLLSPPKTAIRMFSESPPVGLGYLATAIRKLGHEVDIKDCLVEDWKMYDILNHVFKYAPHIIGINLFSTALSSVKELCINIKRFYPKAMIILGGPHCSGSPEHTLKFFPEVDYAFRGEAEIPIKEFDEFLQGKRIEGDVTGLIWRQGDKIIANAPIEYQNIEEFGYPAWDLIDPRKYFKQVNVGDKSINVHFSRGCPFSCLRGDTIINTLDGEFKIRDLVGKVGVKVLTRNPKAGNPEFASAYNISKTRQNAEMVRVHFTDKSYIDCTPDHKFMGFKNGNQFVEVKEKEIEAKDLKKGQSVRAIKFVKSGAYIDICWGRRKRKKYHRLMVEGAIGRKLGYKEMVHHKDKNELNNVQSNLQLTTYKEHSNILHPEIKVRMRLNNPAKNMTPEWRAKLTKGLTGLRRSDEARINYRLSKLGVKNPNYKEGRFTLEKTGRLSRSVNHKVDYVERLNIKEDVYCMEVPGYDWFYANNVLVHNCRFCVKLGNKVRLRSIEHIWGELEYLNKEYGVERFIINDEGYTMLPRLVKDFCRYTIAKGNKYSYFTATGMRLNRLDDEMLDLMVKARHELVFGVGIESAVPRVRQDLMNKHLTQEELENGLVMLNKHGFQPVGNFIIGFTGDTRKEIIQSVNWACKAYDRRLLHGANFVPFLPLPGSEAVNKMFETGELPKDYDFSKINLSRVIYAPKGMTIKELDDLRKWAVFKFNSRPRVLWRYLSDWGRFIRAVVTFIRIYAPNFILPKDWKRI